MFTRARHITESAAVLGLLVASSAALQLSALRTERRRLRTTAR